MEKCGGNLLEHRVRKTVPVLRIQARASAVRTYTTVTSGFDGKDARTLFFINYFPALLCLVRRNIITRIFRWSTNL